MTSTGYNVYTRAHESNAKNRIMIHLTAKISEVECFISLTIRSNASLVYTGVREFLYFSFAFGVYLYEKFHLTDDITNASVCQIFPCTKKKKILFRRFI